LAIQNHQGRWLTPKGAYLAPWEKDLKVEVVAKQ